VVEEVVVVMIELVREEEWWRNSWLGRRKKNEHVRKKEGKERKFL
jgi:hypothetical protein